MVSTTFGPADCSLGASSKRSGQALVRMARIVISAIAVALVGSACTAADQSNPGAQVNASQTLWNTSPTQAFDYFSGYSMHGNNLPAMYAHGGIGEGQAVTVVGKDFHQEFPMSKFSDAVASYKGLLEKQGYHPLYGHPRLPPSTHPLIGSWQVSAVDGTCAESHSFGADGRHKSKSSEEESVGEFDVSVGPSGSGYYRLTDTIVQSNGKTDCTGRTTPVGDVATIFIQFGSDRNSYSMCWSENKGSCFAEARRLETTAQ
jgi:hypothetical protein